jgi:hypothetical protein
MWERASKPVLFSTSQGSWNNLHILGVWISVEVHSSPVRRVFKRIGRITLYCLIGVALLSFGLRVYSAWQIPKAKRLLRDLSTLTTGHPVDLGVQQLLRQADFKLDKSCKDSVCYEAEITGVGLGQRDAAWNSRAIWLLHHGFWELGLRPWSVLARIRTSQNTVVSVNYLLVVADLTPLGVGGAVSNTSWEPEMNGSTQNFSIKQSRQYGSRFIEVMFNDRAPGQVRS